MKKPNDLVDPLGNFPKLPPSPRELTEEELLARLPPRKFVGESAAVRGSRR